jgi:DNA-binding NarL/FixJ family response regulator
MVVQSYAQQLNGDQETDGSDSLTEREREVLQQIAEGKTTRQIGESLFISAKTVEIHRSHLMQKLGLNNTAEIVRYAVRKGIVDREG